MESILTTDTVMLIATQMGKNMNVIVVLIYNKGKGYGLRSNALQCEIFWKMGQGPK